jgi:ArsR family metal-binding transcriptional regulator
MFLNDINITFMEPCVADPEKIRLRAELSDNIVELMPYLNTVISNAIFNKNVPLLSFTKEFRLIVIYPQSLTMAKAVNMTDALQVLDWVKNLINDTWEKRETITPSYERKEKPTVLQLYNWLPKTNCKECGELTCFAFATKLLLGTQKIENCKLLLRDKYDNARETLMDMLKVIL